MIENFTVLTRNPCAQDTISLRSDGGTLGIGSGLFSFMHTEINHTIIALQYLLAGKKRARKSGPESSLLSRLTV